MALRPQKPPDQSVFRLRITLEDIEPVIWRRALVPGAMPLATLSAILLATMGWTNSHLHAFRVGDELYAMHDEDDDPDDGIDENTVTVLDVLRQQKEFRYDYDFGDGWEHEVVIEELTWIGVGLKFAVCLDGQNACPPEDVGGVPGYGEFLAAIADPGHAEHRDYLDWVGGSFDPADFDLASTNAALQRIR